MFFDFTMELPSHISFDNQLKTHFLLTLPNMSVLISRRAVQLLLQSTLEIRTREQGDCHLLSEKLKRTSFLVRFFHWPGAPDHQSWLTRRPSLFPYSKTCNRLLHRWKRPDYLCQSDIFQNLHNLIWNTGHLQ